MGNETLTSGVVYDNRYMKHDTGNHPESAERLGEIYKFLSEKGVFEKTRRIEPYPASSEAIDYVHAESHIRHVKQLSTQGGGMLDLDTVVSPESYEIALLAVGGLLASVDAIMEGTIKNSLCLVRPPGHHALPDRGMGFCLFNNIAIAARYIQRKYNLERVAIVDWDVHHGNGTQLIFYDDPTVYYFSTHQFPHYPGTGAEGETGSGKGIGYTMNAPLLPGTDMKVFRSIFENRFIPAIRRFDADFILISAGFDAHEDDPLAQLRLKTENYRELTEIVSSCANETCNGRIVSTLEGGYNLDALKASVFEHLGALMEA
jgi:acetoin utilization deacetylase AcuC-like enzyme